jgi:hypothetical protein
MTFTKIDINTYEGGIPRGCELVIMEDGIRDTESVLMGFDEVGMLDSEFKNPVYGFLKVNM